jgi:hemerythrin-like domain-containing protein
MLPIAVLMEEHRLIERMMSLLRREAQRIEAGNEVDLSVIDQAVDFIRMYADKTHHAKEENILFRDAAGKNLAADHRTLLQELLDEHNHGRRNVGELAEASKQAAQGSAAARRTILEKLTLLPELYREHIHKEDHIFFPAAMEYFSKKEMKAMLGEFWEADRKMIHLKYETVVGDLEVSGH